MLILNAKTDHHFSNFTKDNIILDIIIFLFIFILLAGLLLFLNDEGEARHVLTFRIKIH